MAEPVIVATSRTPIGRASKGSLVDARPDDMSAFIVKDVLSKVDGLDPVEVEDIIATVHHHCRQYGWLPTPLKQVKETVSLLEVLKL